MLGADPRLSQLLMAALQANSYLPNATPLQESTQVPGFSSTLIPAVGRIEESNPQFQSLAGMVATWQLAFCTDPTANTNANAATNAAAACRIANTNTNANAATACRIAASNLAVSSVNQGK